MKTQLKEIFYKLSELMRQIKDLMKIGNVVSQQEQHLAEYRRALAGMGELINMKDEILKLASDLELQQQEITDQLKRETEDKQKAEAELLEAQENMQKTLRDFAAVTERAERLNCQVNDLSSRLHSAKKEKMNMEVEVMELRDRLKAVTIALETLKEQYMKQLEHAAVPSCDTIELEQTNRDLMQQRQTLSWKNKELEQRIKGLEETVQEKEQQNRELEERKQHLEKRVQIMEELSDGMHVNSTTQNEVQNSQGKLKDELMSKKIELAHVTTDLKYVEERMNRYRRELQQSKEAVEKYRYEKEDLEKQLTIARIHLKYSKEVGVPASEKLFVMGHQRLGEHRAWFTCVNYLLVIVFTAF